MLEKEKTNIMNTFVIKESKNIKCNVKSETHSVSYLIEEYIANTTEQKLKIPIYQRNYVWNKEIFSQFYNDIFSLSFVNNQENFHYIGEITLSINKEKWKTFNVVDGQQRITSILLVMRAIYDYAKLNRYKIDENTKKLFEHRNNGVLANSQFEHIKNNNDFEVLEQILNGKFTEIDNSEDKKTYIYENFVDILKHLGVEQNKKNEFNIIENKYTENEIEKILTNLYTKIIFTQIIHITNEEHLLFESLNSNKALLGNIDLIKNYIIMKIDDNDINNNEKDILTFFNNKIIKKFKKNADIDSFLTAYSKLYLIEEKKSLNIKEMNTIKNLKGINHPPNTWPVFKWIINEQINEIIGTEKTKMNLEDYKKLIMKINEKINLFMMVFDKKQYSTNDKDIFIIQDILSIFAGRTVYIPILMFLVSKFSEYKDKKLIIPKDKIKKLRELLFAFEKFEVIYKVVMYKNESFSIFMDTVLEKINAKYLVKKEKIDHNDILEIFKETNPKYAWNDDRVNTLYEEIINPQKELSTHVRNFFCKRIEYFLDNGLTLDFARDRKSGTDDVLDPSIEHIMPQNIGGDWKKHLLSKYKNMTEIEIENEHKKFRNQLGNLMLINKDANTSFGNELFDKKKYEATNVVKLHQFKGSEVAMKSLEEKLKQKLKDNNKVENELSKFKGYTNDVLNLTHLRQYGNSKEKWEWDFDSIRERTKELANILHYIYKEIKW